MIAGLFFKNTKEGGESEGLKRRLDQWFGLQAAYRQYRQAWKPVETFHMIPRIRSTHAVQSGVEQSERV